MEDFVNEHYSIERFINAYKRLIEPLSDKKQWPKVDISSFISAPLHKRGVSRQKKKFVNHVLYLLFELCQLVCFVTYVFCELFELCQLVCFVTYVLLFKLKCC
jgi:hypothetical protein